MINRDEGFSATTEDQHGTKKITELEEDGESGHLGLGREL